MSLRWAYIGMLAGCSFGPPAGEPQLEPELELEFELEPRSPEIAFGDNGLVIVDDLIEPGANEFGRTMALLPSGEIAISAVVARGADLDAAIVRLSAIGGVAGTSIYRTDGEDYLEAMVVDPDGALYAAGASVFSTSQSVLPVLKYVGGELDPGFGIGGQVLLPGLAEQCSTEDRAYQVAFGLSLDREMRLVISGNATETDCIDRDMIAARFDRMTGALDPTFGNGGVISSNAPGLDESQSDNGQDVIALPDGRIVVVGNTNRTGDFDTADAVLWIRGEDGAEQVAGVFQDLDGNGSGSDTFRAVAVDAEGRLVVAGRSYNGTDYDAVVVRFDSTGAIDQTFARQGVYVSNSKKDDRARRLAIDDQGRILIVGYAADDTGEDLVIWRLSPDGAHDPSWGKEGTLTLKWSSFQRGEAIALDGDRAFVSGSILREDGTWALFVYRIDL